MKRYALILLTFSLMGCGAQGGDAVDSVSLSNASAISPDKTATKTVDSATSAALKGIVRFNGAVPEAKPIAVRGNPECAAYHEDGAVPSEEALVQNGLLQNVFVYVKQGLEDYRFDVPVAPAVIENKKCVYVPHVSGVQVGQAVELLNSDPTLHNVHSYAKNQKSWNLGLPFQNMKQTKKFTNEEVMVTLKCDVHPWMIGYVGILKHPYFAVTGANGEFELKNLPPGEYVIEAWHEKFGAQSQTIKIGPQESQQIEFQFNA